MEEDIITFEDFGITIDPKEIENMEREEIEKCKQKIQEIQKMLEQ